MDGIKSYGNRVKDTFKNAIGGTKGAGKTGEVVLPKVKSYEQVRNKAFDIIGYLGYDSKSLCGRLKSSKGNGKVIGRQSADEN